MVWYHIQKVCSEIIDYLQSSRLSSMPLDRLVANLTMGVTMVDTHLRQLRAAQSVDDSTCEGYGRTLGRMRTLLKSAILEPRSMLFLNISLKRKTTVFKNVTLRGFLEGRSFIKSFWNVKQHGSKLSTACHL